MGRNRKLLRFYSSQYNWVNETTWDNESPLSSEVPLDGFSIKYWAIIVVWQFHPSFPNFLFTQHNCSLFFHNNDLDSENVECVMWFVKTTGKLDSVHYYWKGQFTMTEFWKTSLLRVPDKYYYRKHKKRIVVTVYPLDITFKRYSLYSIWTIIFS